MPDSSGKITVGDLREVIKDLPDEMIVHYSDPEYGNTPAYHASVETFEPYLGPETTGLVIG